MPKYSDLNIQDVNDRSTFVGTGDNRDSVNFSIDSVRDDITSHIAGGLRSEYIPFVVNGEFVSSLIGGSVTVHEFGSTTNNQQDNAVRFISSSVIELGLNISNSFFNNDSAVAGATVRLVNDDIGLNHYTTIDTIDEVNRQFSITDSVNSNLRLDNVLQLFEDNGVVIGHGLTLNSVNTGVAAPGGILALDADNNIVRTSAPISLDTSITSGSANAVTGGAIFDALADKVDNSRVLTDVPMNAVFTDTTTDFGVTRGSLNVNVNDRNGDSFVLQPVSSTEAGVMAAADFRKLEGIEVGADVTDTANVNTALGINTVTGATDMVLSQRGTFVSAGGNLPDAPAAGTMAAQYELEVLANGALQWAIAQGGPGTPITVDTVITDGSTNPVTNNAIFDAFALKQDAIGGFTNTQDTTTETLFGEASAPRTLFNVDTADTRRLVGSTFEWMGTTYTVTMGSANAGQVTFTPTLQDTIPDDTMIQFVFQTWTSDFTGTVDVDTLRFANGTTMTEALVVDTALSTTSTNALENRAINTALDTKQDTINTYSETYLGPIDITAQFQSLAGTNTINHSQSVNAPADSVFTFMGTSYTVTSSTEFSITFTPSLMDTVDQLTTITLNRKNTASIDADLSITDGVNTLRLTPTTNIPQLQGLTETGSAATNDRQLNLNYENLRTSGTGVALGEIAGADSLTGRTISTSISFPFGTEIGLRNASGNASITTWENSISINFNTNTGTANTFFTSIGAGDTIAITDDADPDNHWATYTSDAAVTGDLPNFTLVSSLGNPPAVGQNVTIYRDSNSVNVADGFNIYQWTHTGKIRTLPTSATDNDNTVATKGWVEATGAGVIRTGTWTPTFPVPEISTGAQSITATWERVGSVVRASIYVEGHSGLDTGTFNFGTIGGLPFTINGAGYASNNSSSITNRVHAVGPEQGGPFEAFRNSSDQVVGDVYWTIEYTTTQA